SPPRRVAHRRSGAPPGWPPGCCGTCPAGRTNRGAGTSPRVCGRAGRGSPPHWPAGRAGRTPRAYELMAATGVCKVRLYDARQACLTFMLADGVPDVVVAAWAGHAGGGTLAKRVYSTRTYPPTGGRAQAGPHARGVDVTNCET